MAFTDECERWKGLHSRYREADTDRGGFSGPEAAEALGGIHGAGAEGGVYGEVYSDKQFELCDAGEFGAV